MNTLRDLRILPIWVNPQHLVSTAAHILAGHRVKALGVLDNDRLVGTLGLEEVWKAPEGATVGQVMRPPSETLPIETSVRAAAVRLSQEGVDYLPVVDEDRFVGIVTPNMLLREMGRSYDPLSGLSWSDQLREWGTRHLEMGDEVTILFIDLNNFGQYNKRHGHIVGDQVIRWVAQQLAKCIDPTRDILVRYGGDEFAIATLRTREDAETLAELLKRTASGVAAEGTEPVTFAIGIFGGRRGRDREDAHHGATLDNLINMASRAALTSKALVGSPFERAAVEVISGEEPTTPRYRVVGVYADQQGLRPVTTVILGLKDTIISGAAPQVGQSALEAAALATVKAIERTRPEVGLKLEAVTLKDGLLQLKGRVHRGDESASVTVNRRVVDDPLLAVAEATVEALIGD